MRLLLLAILALTGCASEQSTADGPAARQPNVVVIMTDDQGIGDFGFAGNPGIATPHLDALAGESARMGQFYVHPVCTPTRAALLTGRHPQRTRAFDTWIGRALLEPEEVTLAEVLREAGYATGIFGKWHLGDCPPMRPMDQGFDKSLVHRGGGIGQPADPIGAEGRYTDPVLFHDGVAEVQSGYCTDVYFERGIAWMEEQHTAGRPFFLYLPTNAPHGPFHDVPPGWLEHYRASDLTAAMPETPGGRALPPEFDEDRLARIFAMISNVDENVGELTAALDRLGLAEDTIVVFLNDNGPNSRRFVEGLRGMKTEVYEGGVRSPLLVRWPGRLPAREVASGFGAHLDLFPTILDACGVAIPDDLVLDGTSLWPALRDGADASLADRTLVVQAHRGDAPVRRHHFFLRHGDWKLVHPTGFGRETMPNDVPYELYDLARDPFETTDLAAEQPERVTALLARYDAWFESVTGAPPGGAPPPHAYLPPPIHLRHDGPIVTLTRQDWRRDGPGGWSAEKTQGRWRVEVGADAHFDIAAHPVRGSTPARAILACGEARVELTRASVRDPFVRLAGALPPGVHELRVELLDESGVALGGPYQVELTPSPSPPGPLSR